MCNWYSLVPGRYTTRYRLSLEYLSLPTDKMSNSLCFNQANWKSCWVRQNTDQILHNNVSYSVVAEVMYSTSQYSGCIGWYGQLGGHTRIEKRDAWTARQGFYGAINITETCIRQCHSCENRHGDVLRVLWAPISPLLLSILDSVNSPYPRAKWWELCPKLVLSPF